MMKRETLAFLNQIKVDTRFISLVDDKVFINNLRFSRFSRNKEFQFQRKYPNLKVVRSKLFMKISTRASKTLKDQLGPRKNVFVAQDNSCISKLLYAILEPYTRKYGIKIIQGEDYADLPREIDLIAMPLDLDGEVINLVEKMFKGDKISLISSQDKKNSYNLLYPLINVPRLWIEDWGLDQNLDCDHGKVQGPASDLIKYLSVFIPDVREKMLRSAQYLDK